ncbi:MAG: hypothetical protein H7039_10870 [Bryobacteraceae bacterium]|nr:hypothetical protein [Bryobacteraceae bacterium]
MRGDKSLIADSAPANIRSASHGTGAAQAPVSGDWVSPSILRFTVKLLQFRPSEAGCFVVQFSPVTQPLSPAGVVYQIAAGLMQLGGARVLVLDLNRGHTEQDFEAAVPLPIVAGFSESVTSGYTLAQPTCQPDELLRFICSESFRLYLNSARRRFTCILIATAPVDLAIEPVALAPMCDGVVLVAAVDATSVTSLSRAQQEIRSARGNILGFVTEE